MRSDWPVNLSKCLNVALPRRGVNFIGTRFNKTETRRAVPLTALAKLRIRRELGGVNLELDYEAVKPRGLHNVTTHVSQPRIMPIVKTIILVITILIRYCIGSLQTRKGEWIKKQKIKNFIRSISKLKCICLFKYS